MGVEPVSNWWRARSFAQLQVPGWMRELLSNTQPILLALQEKIRALTAQLQAAANPKQARGLGLLSSVVIDREIGSWPGLRIGDKWAVIPGFAQANTVAAIPECKVA